MANEWITKVDIPKCDFPINHSHGVLFLGSCFAGEIGERMSRLRYNTIVNPFGVLYNPASISNSLALLTGEVDYSDDYIINREDLFFSLMHSSEFADSSRDGLLSKIEVSLRQTRAFFEQSSYIVVTLGTSRVYRHNVLGSVVANCHKLSSASFTREIMDVDSVAKELSRWVERYPQKRWIFTVSPVRHWKDGAHGNQISKAILLLAVQKIVEQNSNCIYFPAFEILLDELRDYRFYASDMLHPSQQAADYIWSRFCDNYIDSRDASLNKMIERLNGMDSHRLFYPESAESKRFIESRERLRKDVERSMIEIKEDGYNL